MLKEPVWGGSSTLTLTDVILSDRRRIPHISVFIWGQNPCSCQNMWRLIREDDPTLRFLRSRPEQSSLNHPEGVSSVGAATELHQGTIPFDESFLRPARSLDVPMTKKNRWSLSEHRNRSS